MPVKVLLKEMRIKRGLSQNELARKVEMSLNAIQHIEYKARAIQLDTLAKLCEALDCQPGDILVYMPNDDGGQRFGVEQEEFKELEQSKDSADKFSPRTNKRTCSFLPVALEVLDSTNVLESA
ncbi:hypothetical protein B7486_51440 [cyanobacterium TDX16]|nr:hypothetical protein B7486_51440 [cyanobacterium TDX16]